MRERTTEATRLHPMNKRIQSLPGSSIDESILAEVRRGIGHGETVLVVLDSDHTAAHVRQELEMYAPLVTPGSYLVVFDGVMEMLADAPNGLPEWATDNPSAAVREFLGEHPEFEAEPRFNRLGATYAPGGFLRRREAA